MDPGSELEYEMPGVLRLYKSGRIERFDGTDTVQPSPSGDPANGVASKDVVLDPAAGISARLYLPLAAVAEPGKKLPVVIFFHGGAFVVHTAASPLYHMYAASLAAAAPAVVVSADYRLAPEHRVPAAYDDAFAALKAVVAACRPDGAEPWLAAHGDASRVVLTGDSAGANMSHNAAIRLRKEGIEGYGDRVSGVALLHPYFWGKEPLGGESTDAGYRGQFDRTWEFICGGKFGLDHPYVDPAASPEEWRQVGCGRVLVTTAEHCTRRGSRSAGGRASSSSTRQRARGMSTSCPSPTATMPSRSSPSWPNSSGAVEAASLVRPVHRLVVNRDPKFTNFVEVSEFSIWI